MRANFNNPKSLLAVQPEKLAEEMYNHTIRTHKHAAELLQALVQILEDKPDAETTRSCLRRMRLAMMDYATQDNMDGPINAFSAVLDYYENGDSKKNARKRRVPVPGFTF